MRKSTFTSDVSSISAYNTCSKRGGGGGDKERTKKGRGGEGERERGEEGRGKREGLTGVVGDFPGCRNERIQVRR